MSNRAQEAGIKILLGEHYTRLAVVVGVIAVTRWSGIHTYIHYLPIAPTHTGP